MRPILGVTDDAFQKQTCVLPDGTKMSFTMLFSSLQQGWFITSLTYGDFILNGLRITNSPDMLYQWKNVLPFGLGCFSKQNREPSLAQDFSSGASVLYLLDGDEVAAYEDYLGATT